MSPLTSLNKFLRGWVSSFWCIYSSSDLNAPFYWPWPPLPDVCKRSHYEPSLSPCRKNIKLWSLWHLAGWPGHNCSIATTSDATNAPCATRRGAAAIFDGTSGAISCDQRLPTGGCISKNLVAYACLSWYLQAFRHSERWLVQSSSDKSFSTWRPTSERISWMFPKFRTVSIPSFWMSTTQ